MGKAPTPDPIREAALLAVGQLTAIELGDADDVAFHDSWDDYDTATVITALLSLCITFARHVAQSESIEQIEVYRRTAAGIISGQ